MYSRFRNPLAKKGYQLITIIVLIACAVISPCLLCVFVDLLKKQKFARSLLGRFRSVSATKHCTCYTYAYMYSLLSQRALLSLRFGCSIKHLTCQNAVEQVGVVDGWVQAPRRGFPVRGRHERNASLVVVASRAPDVLPLCYDDQGAPVEGWWGLQAGEYLNTYNNLKLPEPTDGPSTSMPHSSVPIT